MQCGADESIRVFLLDDHEIVRRGLVELLKAEPDIRLVGQGATAHGAVDRILALRPDVAVLDARFPDGSGIEVCREARSADPSIHALILTSFDDEDALLAAIMAGAAGYLLKQIQGDDLVDAIRRVAAGQSLLNTAVTQRVLDRVRNAEVPRQLRSLTPQEHRILDLLGEGLTNRQIGFHLGLAEKTVKNYISNLFTKLGLERRTQAAVLATRLKGRRTFEQGFRLSETRPRPPQPVGAARRPGPASRGLTWQPG